MRTGEMTQTQFLRKLEHDLILNKQGTEAVNPWMQTHSGRAFYPTDCESLDAQYSDIAHALSNICRFGGHCKKFYSVLNHSVLTHDIAVAFWPDLTSQERLTVLMHDATEAYIGDMVKPVKVNMEQFNELEEKLWKILAKKFNLLEVLPNFVKLSDVLALIYEKNHLMSVPLKKENQTWFFAKGVNYDAAKKAQELLSEANFKPEYYFDQDLKAVFLTLVHSLKTDLDSENSKQTSLSL
jgi:hypothetical protein